MIGEAADVDGRSDPTGYRGEAKLCHEHGGANAINLGGPCPYLPLVKFIFVKQAHLVRNFPRVRKILG